MSKTIETTYRNVCVQLPEGVYLPEDTRITIIVLDNALPQSARRAVRCATSGHSGLFDDCFSVARAHIFAPAVLAPILAANNPPAYAFVCAFRAAIRYLDKFKKEVSPEMPDAGGEHGDGPETQGEILDWLAFEHRRDEYLADIRRKRQCEALLEALSRLSHAESCVLRFRYGIGGAEKKSYQELDDGLDRSAGYLRQVKSAALRKLRPALEEELDRKVTSLDADYDREAFLAGETSGPLKSVLSV